MTDVCTEREGHFDFASFLLGVTISFFATAICLSILQESAEDVRKEAAEHHHGRWVLDSDGRRHFEWIEPWESK